MKARRIFFKITSVVLFFALIVAFVGFVFFSVYKPSLTADFSKLTGDVTNGASGYLYGIAEDGVPSYNMTESVDISTVSQKVVGGLQHPIGDIDNVSNQLNNTKYNVVYLQDAYSTWYYENDNILKARKAGTYNWKNFISNDYLEKVKVSVTKLSSKTYKDKVVYCPYNECDNGVWFGTTVSNSDDKEYGVKGEFDSNGRENFYSAWKTTYNEIKKINPNALIGGPGYFEYDKDKISDFLSFCKLNDCVPDVMIYHELADDSVYFWQDNVNELKEIEKSLSINDMPIIVTEYGRMKDNGLPGKMIQYITQIESSKVYADNAYWRLADNLCDVAADDNCPNSNWWLYRWYTDMEGKTATVTYSDILKSNFKKSLSKDIPLRSKGFMGIASISEGKDKVEIICGGRDNDANIILKGLSDSALNNNDIDIKIEETVYKGLSGVVNSPVRIKEYKSKIINGKLKIKLNDLDEGNAYRIVISKIDNNSENYTNDALPTRYEAEKGKLQGNSYAYQSAYATTGENKGLVGGIESTNDGVLFNIKVKNDGDYSLETIYGKANDGKTNEDRVNGVVELSIDGKSEDLQLSNTIKSEYTSCVSSDIHLTKGTHTIEYKYKKGTFVLDSIVLTPKTNIESIYTFKDLDRTNKNKSSFLAVAPNDGYYSVDIDSSINSLSINEVDADISSNQRYIYLPRGLNYIDFKGKSNVFILNSIDSNKNAQKVYNANDAKFFNGAKIIKDSLGDGVISNISSSSGKAVFDVQAKQSGQYFITINYANNDEGGAHDYNVDLIERYVTISANKTSKDVYCRNTYSWDTYKTVTTSCYLKKGNNKIAITNSGNKKFDDKESYIPNIKSITVSSASADLS